MTADSPEAGDSSIQGGDEPYTGELRYRYRLGRGRLTVSKDTASPMYSRAPANVYSFRKYNDSSGGTTLVGLWDKGGY